MLDELINRGAGRLVGQVRGPLRATRIALALVALATLGGLAGCDLLPRNDDGPKKAEPAPQQKQQADRAAQQRRDAQRKAAEEKEQAEQCLASLPPLKDVQARWREADARAASAPRLALSGPLGVLQGLRRELAETPQAPCSAQARADLGKGMDISIAYYGNFLRNDRDYLEGERQKAAQGTGDRQVAKALLDSAAADLARIESCKGAC